MESLPAPVLLEELNRGQPGRFRAPDTPLILSLLAGIDDAGVPEAGARGRGVVAGQDAAACGCCLASLPSPALLDALNRGQLARFGVPDLPLVRSLLAGICDGPDGATCA